MFNFIKVNFYIYTQSYQKPSLSEKQGTICQKCKALLGLSITLLVFPKVNFCTLACTVKITPFLFLKENYNSLYNVPLAFSLCTTKSRQCVLGKSSLKAYDINYTVFLLKVILYIWFLVCAVINNPFLFPKENDHCLQNNLPLGFLQNNLPLPLGFQNQPTPPVSCSL